jgi:hypothetical protein
MTTPRLGDPIISTDKDGKERRSYVTVNPDRRTAPHRRMKKDIAEQAKLREKREAQECLDEPIPVFDGTAIAEAYATAAEHLGISLMGTNIRVLDMLESYQLNVERSHDGLLKIPYSKDIDGFLQNSDFKTYIGKLYNHPIDYVGNVGIALMEALPNSGFTGSATLTFVAI